MYRPEQLEPLEARGTVTVGILIAANQLMGREQALDYGCGIGRSTEILQRQINSIVVGTDRRLDMLAFASEHHKENKKLIFTPQTNLDLGTFDGALAAFVHVEATSFDELRSIDATIANLLKRDGMYAILTGNPAANGKSYRSFSTEKIEGAADHTRVRTRLPGELVTIDRYWTQAAHERSLRDAGFGEIRVDTPKILGEREITPPYLLITAKKH